MNNLEIGLNLQTLVLINVLIILTGLGFAIDDGSGWSRLLGSLITATALVALTFVVMAVPHEPLFMS